MSLLPARASTEVVHLKLSMHNKVCNGCAHVQEKRAAEEEVEHQFHASQYVADLTQIQRQSEQQQQAEKAQQHKEHIETQHLRAKERNTREEQVRGSLARRVWVVGLA